MYEQTYRAKQKVVSAIGLALVVGVSLGIAACGGDGGDELDRHLRYIRGDTYPALAMEVDYVTNFGPRTGVASELEDELPELLDKPDGVEVRLDEELAQRGSNHTWTFEELDALADETTDMQVDDETAKIHVMFVDGEYESEDDDATILGLAWRHRHIAIFKETLEESCEQRGLPGPFGRRICARAEKTVWTHEVGHVIGLVDNGLEMVDDHRDAEHGKHCNNDECVMYWAQRTGDIFGRLRDRFERGNESALGFDDNCRQDIETAREE